MTERVSLPQGTLDLLILKTLALERNSSLFPTALESPRGFTREPKVITTE